MIKKECQNCKNEFEITDDDLGFYTKINVPPPTFCPECRLVRRIAYRENRPLYKDICNKCGKKIICIFAPESKINTYCSNCWWGDSWDPLDFGQDYDFTKPFLKQFYELQTKVPREAMGSKNCENCEYSNGDVRCKNCVLTFDCLESVDCYNSQVAVYSKDSIDADTVINADHAYENLSCNNMYNSKFAYYSDDCIDCSFIYNCSGCTNCFGCINLRNKKYYFWNKALNKDEYLEELKKWNLGSYLNIKKAKENFLNVYYLTPHRFALIKNSYNVTGDDIINSKNCINCFFTRNGIENCKYIFSGGFLLKDSLDATFGGDKSEMLYESNGGMQSQRCFFSRAPYNSRDIYYSNRVINCSNMLGCVNIRNKEYCILNKQYTKETYNELKNKIINHMNEMPYVDKMGRIYKYGEFHPIELSLWAYNESWAHKYFPLNKEESLSMGYKWQDNPKRSYQITIKSENLPDHIDKVTDEITDEVIECEHNNSDCNQQCTEVYKILPDELSFYRQMNLALPRLCPMCRHYERLKFHKKLTLWKRRCMKEGCFNIFETSISPERKEIVYCEKCYQREFL
jgi:hypothetical protein